MPPAIDATAQPPTRRRDRQREETRRDLADAALELASARGLAKVRVPEIAEAAGVSTRTFNNYFSSKEAAIVWPVRRRAERMAADLLARPAEEPLADALVVTVTGMYRPRPDDGPVGWVRAFRELVAAEPGLHGEYLKAASTGEQAMADAIVRRADGRLGAIEAGVLAAMVVAAERAAVRGWMSLDGAGLPIVDAVRAAVRQAVAGVDS